MEYYVIQAFSNCEKKVKAALEERIDMSGLSKMFGEIMIPTEQVTELKKGQKKQMERKFFPGYMLVQMEMNDDMKSLMIESFFELKDHEMNKVKCIDGEIRIMNIRNREKMPDHANMLT